MVGLAIHIEQVTNGQARVTTSNIIVESFLKGERVDTKKEKVKNKERGKDEKAVRRKEGRKGITKKEKKDARKKCKN